MTATAGQDATLKKGGETIAGVRVSNFSRDATPIDISDRDSAGYQELMAGKVSSAVLNFNVEGVEKDRILRNIAFGPVSGYLMTDLEFKLADGATITGDFFFGSYGEGEDYKEASTFTGSFTSSGPWVHTLAPDPGGN